MTSQQIRNQFLEFFKSKQHTIVPSAPVVPYDDPTLLFTNAGMNQFKDVFLGKGNRDYKRAADTQKCIRVSGKHNDLEEVGHDTYHHTFFEMLGNWSFGDYYKEEAITWAWELLTEVWKLPKERLWATVFETDDEALNLWKTKTDINPNHVLKFGAKDNFWEMGETGPCGPCSEIHINLTDDYENPKYVNTGVPECLEIWNLVFIQNNRDENGILHDLPAKHVDTGMGFERVCAVLQSKNSNYDTDVFQPLIQEISKISKIPYDTQEHQIPMRVIADHIRTLTFAIGDGAVPGNDGRSYVLRRILRRAARYGRKLNLNEPFMYKLVDVLVKTMSDVFPEIKSNQANIEKIIKAEEESFNATLDRGISLFEEISQNVILKNAKVIPGEDVFKLYDTFGFPVDLTNVMAQEKGLRIDEDKFNILMNEQKVRARKANKVDGARFIYKDYIPDEHKVLTEFVGYDNFEEGIEITEINRIDDLLIFNKTPFYAESGGQIGDTGTIYYRDQILNIVDTQKFDNTYLHKVDFPNDPDYTDLPISIFAPFIVQVNIKRRWEIMRNHSATHFLHAALRQILGTHVKQAGSYVGPDRLRFDFAHFQKVTHQELQEIESLVNFKLHENIELQHHRNITFDEAKKMGALMFFGDKYGDKVNVVQFGDFSLEFCGGTHVKNSSQIGLFKIISESSIASGVRRIEAVTGLGVEKYIHNQILELRNADEKIAQLNEEKKKIEKELSEIKLKEKLGGIDTIVNNPFEKNGINIFKGKVDVNNMDELKSMGDELREKIRNGVGVLISEIEGKVGIVCVVTDDLISTKKLSAGKIVGEIAKIVGGGGGGRLHLATAGGKDISKIDEALSKVEEFI
ncbi:MAG: alanine--tRNA ligase [Ignavibacteriae bacterium]|nr:alanine--tRNA ligase [Ignavibacteriota bacterium]